MSSYLNSFPGNTIAEQMSSLADKREKARLNRRQMIAALGATGAAGTFALAGCSSGQTQISTTPVATGPTVVDVLNFALNLEYLEASFYLFATTGAGLSTTDMGSSPGTVTGGAQVPFVNAVVASVAAQLATDEREHVEFLQTTISAIGGTPVGMPTLNLAANGAITSDATFVAAARQLETVGISAYIGGAQYLVSSTTAVLYAAQILDTEAQHEGFLRELCLGLSFSSPAVDSQDLPPTNTQIFNTDPMTGLNAVRTTSQVLQIVYGAAGQTGVSKGGFYPNGMNGTITTS